MNSINRESLRVAVATDSNAGISAKEAEELGVFVLPMPFYVNGEEFFEGITLSQPQFYEKLSEGADISTSQPSPDQVLKFWKDILDQGYDKIVYIPMSSALSASCESAQLLAKKLDGRVLVADNHRISVSQQQSVKDALVLLQAGYSPEQTVETLLETGKDQSIYISVETLSYLKKGGRITKTAAALGTVLSIKPVLQIQGEKVDSFSKARGMKASCNTMLKAIQKDLDTRFKELDEKGEVKLQIAYTGADDSAALEWKALVEKTFPGREIYMAPLSLSISCHIGPGALALAISRIVQP